MNKEHLVKLCLAVYRVSELFPKEEPLKFSIREKANQILADSFLIFSKNPLNLTRDQKNKVFEQILRNIEILKGYFEVAKGQKWVEEENFLVLEKEYGKIEEEISKKSLKKDKKPLNQVTQLTEDSSPEVRNERCRKILEVLKEKKMAQVRDFKEIFPEVSKRTLRRDFDYLLGQGLVRREGEGSTILYKLT